MINCADESGLIYKITSVVFTHKLNIISNDEFVERNYNHFFMRTEFSGDFDRDTLLRELYNILPADAEIKLSDNRKKDIVILVTKEYHCLSDLLVRHKFNDLPTNILAVISNYANLQDLTIKFDIPFYCIEHENKTREEHEAEILALLQQFNPKFLVLAKYMRVLSPSFLSNTIIVSLTFTILFYLHL